MKTSKQIMIYTDCSEENRQQRIGALIFGCGAVPLCGSWDVPSWVLAWSERKQYINQGDLLAGPVLAICHTEVLRGWDVLWFIDNTSALAALIKGSSGVPDSARLAMRATATLTACRCRVWYEYVASAQNPADVLSRAAWQDARVRQNIQDGLWKRLPAIPVDWAHLTGSSLEDLWSDIEALGI